MSMTSDKLETVTEITTNFEDSTKTIRELAIQSLEQNDHLQLRVKDLEN